jgi:hypothetical protein
MFKKIWKVSKANTFLEQSLGYVTGDSKKAMRYMRELAKEFPNYESVELAFAYLVMMHTGEIGAGIANVSGTTSYDRWDTLIVISKQLNEARANELIDFGIKVEIEKPLMEAITALAKELGIE